VEARATSHTKAVMPVHLFGQIAPMDTLLELAHHRGLAVVEDAAQAHGATQNGRSAGSFGVLAGTSCYPGKNLGAYGDGGAVLTSSEKLAEVLRALRNHGSAVKYRHDRLGFNSRLDSLQAVVLSAKLARLATWNAQRRSAAARYDELLEAVEEVRGPTTLPGNEHVWHLYVIRVSRRDRVFEHLRSAGIGAGIHYPVPIHLDGAIAQLGYRPGDFPSAERAAGEILSLPMYPHITPTQQERVV